jgi:hypothetical protein
MNRNYVSPTGNLVTLDATVAHPGFDPFRHMKARRDAEQQLRRMDLNLTERMALGLITVGATPPAHVELPAEAVRLAETIRDAGK